MTMSRLRVSLVAVLLGGLSIGWQRSERPMPDVRLMTVDPGHFHAGLVQKEMCSGRVGRVDVYAPLGARPDRTPQPHRRLQQAQRGGRRGGRWSACEPGLLRAHAARAPGQRRHLLRPQSREDRAGPRVGARGPARARGQAVDPDVGGICRRWSRRSPRPTREASSPTTS
jgi:hypothetical protein